MVKLCVIGRDVSKSASPPIHNFIAGKLNVDISYEKISIPCEQFESEIEGLLSGYDGMNVTIPYKLSVIPHLKKLSGDAPSFGAVNTVLCSSRTGYNTDGLGFMQMLSANGVEVKGKSALVLGAGGAGRSVAKKLSDGGASVEIYDRNAQSAQNVSNEFGGIRAIAQVNAAPRDIIVNATGVGMHESEGKSPVPAEIICGCSTAVDLIYVPAKSEFLRIAEGLGKKIINGEAMLFYQAYYSDCIYFGMQPDGALAAKLFGQYLKEKNI